MEGKLIRAFARKELEELYGFDIIEKFDFGLRQHRPHVVKALRFLRPNGGDTYSGAWGAGSAALKQYLKLLKESELQNLEDNLRDYLERCKTIIIRMEENIVIEKVDKKLKKLETHELENLEDNLRGCLEQHKIITKGEQIKITRIDENLVIEKVGEKLKGLETHELKNLEDNLRKHFECQKVEQGEKIKISLENEILVIEKLGKDSNLLLGRLDRNKGWYGVNNIEEIADYLETHRVKRGLYAGKLEDDIYTCIFVGPPDSILRH